MSLETFADLESAIHRYFQDNEVEIETRRKELGVTDALKDVPYYCPDVSPPRQEQN